MFSWRFRLYRCIPIVAALFTAAHAFPAAPPSRACSLPILVYHRFAAGVEDSMTVRTSRFEAQLRYLRDHGYQVVPLRSLVECLYGKGPPIPPRSVAITADDGHRSVFVSMAPLVERYRIPVTLFIYPSAISNADYALTWDQLRNLVAGGRFQVQDHSFWHPNFKAERKRLDAEAYRALIRSQLARSRRSLQEHFGVVPDMIAWPFGYVDDVLIGEARAQGFVAGFTLERRRVRDGDDPMALPRFLMVDSVGPGEFARLLEAGQAVHEHH